MRLYEFTSDSDGQKKSKRRSRRRICDHGDGDDVWSWQRLNHNGRDDLGADEHHHDFDHNCGHGYLYISIIAFIYIMIIIILVIMMNIIPNMHNNINMN